MGSFLALTILLKTGEQERSARRSDDSKWPGEVLSVPAGLDTLLSYPETMAPASEAYLH